MADYTKGMRPSTNIEDRRGETEDDPEAGLREAMMIMALKPLPGPANQPPLPNTTQNPLAAAAGYNDIGRLFNLFRQKGQ